MIPTKMLQNLDKYKVLKKLGFRYCKHPECVSVYNLSDWSSWSGFCYEHHTGKLFK